MELKRKAAALQKVVFELRYRRGYVYLDKCGRTLNALMTQHTEWLPRDEGVSPQNAPLISLRNQCVLNFSSRKLDLALEMQPGGDSITPEATEVFGDQVEATSNLIIEELGLKEFERMGFRAWFLFPFQTMKESHNWLRSLSLFQISESFSHAFGDDLDAVGVVVVFKGPTNYRVALNPVESTAQIDVGKEILSVPASKLSKNQREVFLQQLKVKKKLRTNPEFAIMIDVDAFQDEPKVLGFKDFIKSSLDAFATKLTEATR